MMKQGHPVPDAWLEKELWPCADIYWEAFILLDGERSQGYVPGPIPFTAIISYCNWALFSDEQTDACVRYLFAMDSIYLAKAREYVTKKSK